MTAWVAIAHHLPQRTRLRSPILRSDPVASERLAETLAALPGVREVRVRPYTGSALVHHEPTVTVDMLVDTVCHALECTHVLQPGEAPPVGLEEVPALSLAARNVVATLRDIDRDIRRITEGSLDLGTLATLGFAGVGAAHVVTSKELPFPPWFNLAWWAFRTFTTLEKAEIEAEINDTEHRKT